MKSQDLKNEGMFTRQMLIKLIVPLVIEQLLAITVGIVDTLMVSPVGEAAVSGISIVDSINTLCIQVFAALATGGAIVTAQHLGGKDFIKSRIAAKQLIYLATFLSILILVISVSFNEHILRFIFGRIDPSVMNNARIYFGISAMSYPFIALYNSCASLFRVMGNSKISMLAALMMNIVNIGGNAILIYGFDMGVSGAAISTLISRIFASVLMLFLISNKSNTVYVEKLHKIKFNRHMIKNILGFGIPNGIENGMFQIGRLTVQGLVATFGTAAIAANAIASSIAGFMNIPGSAMALAMITVVGQCVGAEQYDWAVFYTKKLLKVAYVSMGILGVLLFFARLPIVKMFNLSAEATAGATQLLGVFSIFAIIFWTPSFVLPNALRASGDNKFTMMVSMASMWIFRIGFSYVVGQYFNMGLMGVWIAMIIDWVARSIVFVWRFRNDKWKKAKIV